MGRAGSSPAPGTERESSERGSPVSFSKGLAYVWSMLKCIQNTLLLGLWLFISSSSWSQESETYIESNLGLSINDELVFPGLSLLWGKRTFHSETRFSDKQFGLAAPSLVTLKMGQGWRNPNTYRTFSYGVRIWPLHGYVQFGFPNPRCENKVSERTLRRLQRRGKSRENLLCGEWNVSIEGGSALLDGWVDGYFFYEAALWSSAIFTFSHRWYLD